MQIVIIAIALNLIPADATVFEVVGPPWGALGALDVESTEHTFRFTKLATGDWHSVRLGENGLTLYELGRFAMNAGELRHTPPKPQQVGRHWNIMVVALEALFDLAEPPEWATVEKLLVHGGGKVTIERRETEVVITVNRDIWRTPPGKMRGEARERAYVVRWGRAEKE